MKLREDRLRAWLEEAGLPCHATSGPPRLAVTLPRIRIDKWQAEAELIIQPVEHLAVIKPIAHIDLLHFYVHFPDRVAEGERDDCLRLIHLLNKVTQQGGFNYDEVTQQVYLKMSMPASDKATTQPLLHTYLNFVMDCVEVYGPVVRQVARGILSFDEVAQLAAGR